MPDNRDSLRRVAVAIPIVSKLLTWSHRLIAAITALAGVVMALRALGYNQGAHLSGQINSTWYIGVVTSVVVLGLATIAARRLARHIDRQVRYLSSLDALTGLPNRTVLMERLERQDIAVLYLDLDRFKIINDSLGHDIGDEVLRIVAQRIRRSIREGDLLVRLGGDEFVIVVEDAEVESAADASAVRVLSAVSAPIRIQERELFVTGSIGIALKCPQLSEPTEVMRGADLALYRAKRQGRDQRVLFNDSMESNVLEQLDLESDLWRALDREELEVYYQPEVNFETGQITGFEALLRWRHAEHGLLLPERFISLAEENGALREIGLWVLEQACGQWQRWRGLFPEAPMTVSVNLSLRQVEQPDLVDRIEEILERTAMEPSSLKLEITESVLLHDVPAIVNKLVRLRGMGVQLAIDDFGTGYACLNYLKLFPVHSVKIDQSFVQSLEQDDANLLIVQAIVTLAHDLGLDVTAEGVETREQLDFLTRLGCDRGQGFYLAEPWPADSVETMLRTYTRHSPLQAIA